MIPSARRQEYDGWQTFSSTTGHARRGLRGKSPSGLSGRSSRCTSFQMKGFEHQGGALRSDLLRAALVAAIVLQSVVGAVHSSIAAASPAIPDAFICSALPAAPASQSEGGGLPDGSDSRFCPICASNNQASSGLAAEAVGARGPQHRGGARAALVPDNWPGGQPLPAPRSRGPPERA